MDAVRELFREYAVWVGDPNLAELTGRNVRVLIAFHAGHMAGCAVLREIDAGIGEMKRLYVRPAFQGLGFGRSLVERVIAEAKSAGYRALRLDTLPMMVRAIALYRSLEFHGIPRYGDNPPEGICFELSLHCQ
jgi:ribosomal protein S18 acetylase RimI-like enzyme